VITETVIKSIQREANKAGWSLEQALAECAARGWRGFKAEWVAEKQTATQKAQANMHQLTRGLTAPKAAPFWAKPDNKTLEVIHEEPKRLL
jgi:hypothetical protein